MDHKTRCVPVQFGEFFLSFRMGTGAVESVGGLVSDTLVQGAKERPSVEYLEPMIYNQRRRRKY